MTGARGEVSWRSHWLLVWAQEAEIFITEVREVVSLFLNLRVHWWWFGGAGGGAGGGEWGGGFLLAGRAGKAPFKAEVLVTDCVLVTPCPIIDSMRDEGILRF